MAEGKSATKESGSRLIAVLSFFWALIFIAVVLLLFISRMPGQVVQSKDTLLLGKAFPLRGTSPDSYALVGSSLVRIEEEGLAVLDASGSERSFIPFPYRQSQVRSMGQGLLVTPVQGSTYMAIFPDLSTYESDTGENIFGGDYRDSLLLTFGSSLKGRMVASLFDTRTGSYRAVLTFSSLEWPLSLSFIPGADQFDVLMLDLSQGKTWTRYLRCDFDGKLLADVTVSSDDLLPLRAHLGGGRALFYNEQKVVLFDPLTGVKEGGSLPGIPVQAEAGGDRLALLAEGDGDRHLFVTSWNQPGGEGLFQALEAAGGVSCFALAPEGGLILAASGRELLLYDTDAGRLVTRQDIDTGVTRILALSDQHFLVILDKEAVLVTVR